MPAGATAEVTARTTAGAELDRPSCPGEVQRRQPLGTLVPVSTRWLSPKALKLHATVVVVFFGCLALGWWQLTCALSGNALSWVYTFEWPFFAGYAVYMWWKLLPDAPAEEKRETVARPASPSVAANVTELDFDPYDDGDDPELAAYNRYLASLHMGKSPSVAE